MIVSVPIGRTLKRFLGRRYRAEIFRPVEHVNVLDGGTLDAAFKRFGFTRRARLFVPISVLEASVLRSLFGFALFGLYKLHFKRQ